MKEINVRLKENSYKIIVGAGVLKDIGLFLKNINVGKDAVIITNPVINKLYGKKIACGLKRGGFTSEIFEVADGEKSKNVQTAFNLIEKVAAYDVSKKVFIIALGGGVIGDLAGFVASIYKRGIPYIQVPTTFLAQIDSSIGGKVAVDLKFGKNLVGAFYQPKLVLSDVKTLASLDVRQIKSGFSEAVKYGVIYDKNLFEYIRVNYGKLLKRDSAVLSHVVESCSRIKAEVVEKDEKETLSIRTILNFGHTIGHAIETAAGYDKYNHGEAVAIGMRIASFISCRLKMFPLKELNRIEGLLDAIGLPKQIEKVKPADILNAMRYDKKFISGKNRFVLPVKIGKVKIVEDISLDLISAAVKAYGA